MITKWKPDPGGGMVPSPSGVWMRVTDHEATLAERDHELRNLKACLHARNQAAAGMEKEIAKLAALLREGAALMQESSEEAAELKKEIALLRSKLELADALRNRERGLPPDVLTVQAEERIADWEGSRGIVTPAQTEPFTAAAARLETWAKQGYVAGATVERNDGLLAGIRRGVIVCVHEPGGLDVNVDGRLEGWSVRTCKPIKDEAK